MFSSAEKTNRTTTAVQQKAQQQTFFRKAGEETFFDGKEQTSFFNAPVQAKLSVSSPDDPQEKEADAVADQVMRMPTPAASISAGGEEKIDKKEDEEIAAKIETPTISRISRKEESASILSIQTHRIHRMPSDQFESSFSDAGSNITSSYINCKPIGLYHSDVIQRSGRGPPASSIPFEQSLSSSKGAGSALPGDTRQFMESRFNADFSSVRVHTGSQAQAMTSNIHAQAFAHGNDIYFNEGKYAPQTQSGGTLLAHELTHTIQQGASPASGSSAAATKSVARKNIIQRSGSVPVQLTNAVEKAKTVEGTIDANKPQADGFRTGWENLVEIFKTTFGEDMVVSGAGGTSVKGAVSEQDIKKKRTTEGLVADGNRPGHAFTGERDAMPSWCGIFTFWALNKSGVPMPKWKLGEQIIKPETARAPGTMPMPGDIAYRNAFSHYAIVQSVSGNTVTTVNGNTAGEDNLGGQVQTKDHPLSNWTAFFNPLLIMQGSLGSGDAGANTKPKSLADLRKEGLLVNRKEDRDENEIQAKKELSNWHIDAAGGLQTKTPAIQKSEDDKELQKKDEEQKEEEKEQGSGQIHAIQKKNGDDLTHACSSCSHQNASSAPENNIQTKSEYENSSLTNSEHAPVSEIADPRERGPPIQLKTVEAGTVQCSVIDDALSYTSLGALMDCVYVTDLDATSACLLRKARDIAMHIPGYKALRVILNRDPITGEYVERNGRNFIEAAFDIMPGGEQLHRKLDEQHQLDAAAEWIDGKINRLESIVSNLFSRFDNFWNDLGITDFSSPMGVLRDGANIVFDFIGDIVDFAIEAALELLGMVKDFLLAALVDFIKENTTAYPLLTVILGEDPVTKQAVDQNGTNILNALLDLGGEEGQVQREQLIDTGTFDKVVGYIDEGIEVFGGLYETILENFSTIWERITIDALMEPTETFRTIYNIFAEPVTRVLDFVSRVIIEILKLIKEVLFKRISEEAKTVRGYFLMTVIIGKDPFTDEVVPRSVENLIRGFMSLMDGGEEQFQQMKESGAIARAVNKVNAAVDRLNMTLESVIQMFIDLWDSFTFSDFLTPIPTFQRIIAKFGEPIGRLIAFVVEIVKIVVVVILEIMNFPFDLIGNIVTRAMAAFQNIKRDPIGFLKNLLRAIKQGFIQFFDNIVTHLINGVVGWLMSELREAGIPELTDFSLQGVISWVLEVLGISMEKIWEKLAAHPRIGPERVARIRGMINTLEGIWTFIKDVQERGIVAIWEKIQEQLTNLWNTVLDAVKNWVMETIVAQVTVKLLSMLDPTGIMAVINSAIAIYSAVQSFIKYLREMLEIINSFVNGVADIAEGNITTAANYLENTMGRAMPIVIGFLANQVGLGGVGRRIGEMIESVRTMVDEALTWLVNKAVDTGMDLLDRAMAAGRSAVDAVRDTVMGWLGFRQQFTTESGESHTVYVRDSSTNPSLIIESTPVNVSEFFDQKSTAITASTTLIESEKNRKLRSIQNGRNMLRDLQNLMNSSKTSQQNNPAIPGLIASIVSIVREIDPGSVQLAVPNAEFSPGFTTAKASSFSARNVYNGGGRGPANHAPGTEPSEAQLQDEWQVLRDMQLSNRWVRFHILNHNVGGIAANSNLIPTPSYYNNEYRTDFETQLKRYYDQGLPIWFRANVTYRNDYNRYFANMFTANAGAMKMQNETWVEDDTKQISFSRSVDLPETDVYNINLILNSRDDQTLLRRLTTVSQNMINILRTNRPGGGYTNARQMERVLVNSLIPGAMDFTPEHLTQFSPTPATITRVNEYRRGLSSVNWIF